MQGASIHVQHIVCPTDFSAMSENALRHAIAMARVLGAGITILHVLPPEAGPYATAVLPYLLPEELTDPEARHTALAALERFAQPALDAHIPTVLDVRVGDAWRGITAAAREQHAGLIVMGTRGISGARRLLTGSVTDKVLRHLPCAVMTVCHEEGRSWSAPELIQHIVCATDLGETSDAPVAFAALLAGIRHAELTVLHVVGEELNPSVAQHPWAPEFGPIADYAGPALLESFHDAIAASDAAEHTHSKVACGVIHDEILRVAAAERADLIVIGTHVRGPLGRTILGATCDRVVREATCPVLVVPMRKRSETTRHAEPTGMVLSGTRRSQER